MPANPDKVKRSSKNQIFNIKIHRNMLSLHTVKFKNAVTFLLFKPI